MEMTASMMLNSPPNGGISSRMPSFPSSESISSAQSWHGPSVCDKKSQVHDQTVGCLSNSDIGNLIEKEEVLEPIYYQDYVFRKITVDILPEKYGFIKKHVKYLIKASVISAFKF